MRIGDDVVTPNEINGTIIGVSNSNWIVEEKDEQGDITDVRRYEETELRPRPCKLQQDNQHYNQHYLAMIIQPAKMAMDLLTSEEFIGWLKGQMIRYGKRAGFKEGEPPEKDKDKYEHYKSWKNEFEATDTIKELE